MKTWIVSSLDEEIIQGEETIQGRKLYEEIRYEHASWSNLNPIRAFALDLSLLEDMILIYIQISMKYNEAHGIFWVLLDSLS